MSCLFCKIAAKEIPAEVVYEDSATLAFLDIHPRAPGHTMVIARTHAANLLELPDAAVGPLFNAVKKVTAILQRALQPHGFTIGINHGAVSGQAVEHLHVHIMPRYEGDQGGSVHAVVNHAPAEDAKTMAEKIRNAASRMKLTHGQ